MRLAKEIIAIYHGKDEAEKAEIEFNKIFRDKEKPTEMEERKVESGKLKVVDFLPGLELANSKGTAKILVQQGGVKIDNRIIANWNEEIEPKNGMVVQVGKRKFVKIILK